MKCGSCGLHSLAEVVDSVYRASGPSACRRCGAPLSGGAPPAGASAPAITEASCTVRAQLGSALAMLFPALLFGVFALNDRIARAGAQGVMIGVAALSLVGFYWMVRARGIQVTNGEIVLSGPFGSSRAPLRSVRKVKIEELRSSRSGTSRTLVLELDGSGGRRSLRLGLPVDAKPDADLARVFSAIAYQAAEVSFDHMSNRIRLGQLDWG